LLRDGIPLNEHFLALKNKYFNEQSDIKNRLKLKSEEIEAEKKQNEDKKQRIRIMKQEYDRMAEEFRREREAKERELKG
jgi:hypothetical protein